MDNKIKVTKNFVEYSMELANDILGYNECFGGEKEVKKKLKYHINQSKKYIDKNNDQTE